ncbi:lamin-B1-like isoform X2 [Patiria miniata]|uniref:Lamin n=1 Tax=Patiria miniata TaxID=46514 RepID=A0A914BLB8_PATMI|nr:lamin-B1-like isoform X2 [Patiria miniata]
MSTPMMSQRTSTRSSKTVKHVVSSSSTRSSPRSPTAITRTQEKEDLMDLNDRLAIYIDRVRSLESDNSRLMLQLSTVEETQAQEISNLKYMYEKELADMRKLLDDTAKEKARLQIELGKYRSDLDELKPKYRRLEKDLDAANKRIQALETSLGERDGRISAMMYEKKQLDDLINELRKNLAHKEKQLNSSKKQVEEETVLRVDLENRLQSLKEELEFKKQLYDEEVKELRSKSAIDFTEIDSQARSQYESKLIESLQELREQHELQTMQLREETESMFESKLSDLKALAERYRNASVTSQDDLRIMRTRVDNLQSELNSIKAQNDALIARIKDLEDQLKMEQDNHYEALNDRDKELQQLRDAMAHQMLEYQELMNIKLSLDTEIAAYRKLLEGEETRLKITPSPPRHKSHPTQRQARGTKRRRLDEEESMVQSSTTTGLVVIIESDLKGDFIKLQNASDQDQALGGWLLKRQVNGGEELSYKFSSKYVLKSGKEVTVWASGSGHGHNPPSDLVFKNQKTWGSGKEVVSTLVDASGEVMATRTMSTTSISYDGDSQEGDNRGCSIM